MHQLPTIPFLSFPGCILSHVIAQDMHYKIQTCSVKTEKFASIIRQPLLEPIGKKEVRWNVRKGDVILIYASYLHHKQNTQVAVPPTL